MPRNTAGDHTALSVAETARMLGVTDETVKRYFLRGQLEGFKLPGGHYRVFLSSVEKMIGKGENDGNSGR